MPSHPIEPLFYTLLTLSLHSHSIRSFSPPPPLTYVRGFFIKTPHMGGAHSSSRIGDLGLGWGTEPVAGFSELPVDFPPLCEQLFHQGLSAFPCGWVIPLMSGNEDFQALELLLSLFHSRTSR